MKRAGVPIVFSPLAAPGADVPWAGSTQKITTEVYAGAYAGATTVYYAVSYVGADGSESARSVVESITIGDAETFRLSPVAFDPPAGATVGYITPTGWKAYLGSSAYDLRLATPVPLSFSANRDDARSVPATRSVLRNGQAADCVVPYRDLILRG